MSFPPEILNLFIDQLGLTLEEDPPSGTALLACTLVNRQFYHQASSYIFSSLSISARNTDGRSQRRLNALLDIIKANPNITRHIHSLTVEVQTCTASLPAVLRQLDHLQEFTWIDSQQRSLISSYFRPPPIVTSSIKNLCNVTALHFYGLMNLPLSLLSQCCHLESLTLIWVRFAEIERNTLSESLFSSLKKLEISGVITGRDVEAMRIIMIRAAHTLTTLILRDTYLDDALFQNPSLAVFPVLGSIKMYCTISPGDALPPFISKFLDFSAPMVNQIRIQLESDVEEYFASEPSGSCFIFDVVKGWSPIDNILSTPKYPSLKSLDLTFSQKHPLPVTSEVAVRTLLNKILPVVSSCSRTEIKIRTSCQPFLVRSCMDIRFVF